MITLHEFQTKIYVIGEPDTTLQCTVTGNHYKYDYGTTVDSYEAPGPYPNTHLLKFRGGTDTVYLPYKQGDKTSGKITSITLPRNSGPNFFVTANMSGCALYLARNDKNHLIAFHANTQMGSDEATARAHAPSYQSPGAAQLLDTCVRTAMPNHGGRCTVVGHCSKTQYWSRVDRHAATGDQFLGGTTIAGWRTGTQWEFWYQAWGSVGGSAARLIHVEKFFQE